MSELTDHVTLVLPSNTKDVSKVENFIDEFSEKNKLNEDLHGTLAITVTEVVNNAILHGNKNDISKNVTVELLKFKDKIQVHVKDEGEGFDLSKKPDPLKPENIYKSNGRGVFIIENMMSEVSYKQLEDGFKVIMEIMIDV